MSAPSHRSNPAPKPTSDVFLRKLAEVHDLIPSSQLTAKERFLEAELCLKRHWVDRKISQSIRETVLRTLNRTVEILRKGKETAMDCVPSVYDLIGFTSYAKDTDVWPFSIPITTLSCALQELCNQTRNLSGSTLLRRRLMEPTFTVAWEIATPSAQLACIGRIYDGARAIIAVQDEYKREKKKLNTKIGRQAIADVCPTYKEFERIIERRGKQPSFARAAGAEFQIQSRADVHGELPSQLLVSRHLAGDHPDDDKPWFS